MSIGGTNDRKTLIDLIRNRIDEDTFEGKYEASVRKRVLFILLILTLSVVLFFVAIALGAVDIPLIDVLKAFGHRLLPGVVGAPSQDYYSDFIFKGRMPRMFLVILTGFSLGVAGMIMQGLLRNPLVSPFTLGVSTAASFGAAIAIVFGTTAIGVTLSGTIDLGIMYLEMGNILKILFAFAFAMVSIVLILLLSRGKNTSRSMVILSGVVISYLFQAGIMASKYFADDAQLREITLWIMGSMTGATWGTILILFPIVLLCGIFLFKTSVDINALSAGDDVASSLGVNVQSLRKKGLIVCTLMTAACLAFTGVIGFIGLMAPHICRMIIGNDSRYLMPAAGLMGVLILSVSDLFCRLIIRPGELPVGIVLYITGGIFFIWLIANKKWSQRI
ncbi:MAG: iron ABC transporter permease [Methanomassiliicoccaceae archaeon]|jgi:iron complex transport system permease protein|nr:iron ABC transporter permease [Methanomassiliicoccaceae archaeon]